MSHTQSFIDQTGTHYWEMLPCGLMMAKCLDVSTSHITKQDNMLLSIDCDVSPSAATVFRKAGGYFVHILYDEAEENDQELLEAGYSAEFIRIIQIARAEGASWICLDSTAEDTDFLPTFNW